METIGTFFGANAERHLLSWFSKQVWASILPTPFEFKASFQRRGGFGIYTNGHLVLLPHEVFGALYQNARELFENLFVGDTGNLERFWSETQRTDPEYVANHPCTGETPPNFRVPVGMHGDDAGIFESEKALILSWNSVAVNHLTIDNRILFGTLLYTSILPGVTLQQFYKVFVWSMNCLSRGFYPYEDHEGKAFGADYYPQRAENAGKAIAGGYVGAWSEFRGGGPVFPWKHHES